MTATRTLACIAVLAWAELAVPAAAFSSLGVTIAPVPSLDPSVNAATWEKAASVDLTWDVVRARPAAEPTKARVMTDGHYLYVRFDAKQSEAIAASQRTNDVGQGADDEVWIDLWPGGQNGYFYQFIATPIGTHYEFSSENTSYSPTWESRGRIYGGGYTVTMKIPFNAIRGAHKGLWKAQFVRYIHATGEEQVWSYDLAQTSPDDIARAGSLMMPAITAGAAQRPKPRVAVYGLGEAASRTIGGPTSRAGADISVPITSTASFYATFHPDYSNVELDQQSIAPTVYQRYYSEVRPFFTQAANFYDQFNCDACPAIQELYTPAIPTPVDGYAVEGKQGPLSFATFDAVGDQRDDIASALDYTSPNLRWQGTVQRVSADLPGLLDTVTTTGIDYSDLKHISFYFNYGSDSGTNVLVPDDAQRYDFGGGWANQTFGFFGSVRKLGAFYDPVDGFVSHPGIAGYALYTAKIWDFDKKSAIESIGLSGFMDRYQGPTMGSAQSDNQVLLDILTKSALDLQLYSGSNYWRFGDVLTPVSQGAGFQLTYDGGLQTNNPGNFPNHGSSATPTSIQYLTGRYGNGRLDTWFRNSTMRLGTRGAVTLTVDDTAQWLHPAPSNVQWFDSFSYAYQIGHDSSIAIGLRRVQGMPPIPNGGGDCIGVCSNISAAFHQRFAHSELYIAYGDPNTLTTVPQFIFKFIFYAGADKGE